MITIGHGCIKVPARPSQTAVRFGYSETEILARYGKNIQQFKGMVSIFHHGLTSNDVSTIQTLGGKATQQKGQPTYLVSLYKVDLTQLPNDVLDTLGRHFAKR